MHFIKNLTHKQRIIFFITSAIILAGLAYFIAVSISRIGKIQTVVKYAPYAASVTLNGTKIANNRDIWLEPGQYEVKVEYDHFKTAERTVEITRSYNYIVGILEPSDSAGEAYVETHKKEFTETEGTVGQALVKEGVATRKQYPILDYLPINNRLYSISYYFDDDNSLVVSVKSSLEYLDAAVGRLKNLENIDLATQRIQFTATNPFATYADTPKSDPVETIKASFDLSKYKLTEGQYIAGEYYVAMLYCYNYDRDLTYAHYRVLLKQTDESWHILTTPQPIFTQENSPNIPQDIFYYANLFEP